MTMLRKILIKYLHRQIVHIISFVAVFSMVLPQFILIIVLFLEFVNAIKVLK